MYHLYSDKLSRPTEAGIPCYSVQEILAEKLRSLIQRSYTALRDFYDIWYFVSVYLKARFGKDWCLSPEQSLLLQSGNRMVPKQLLVRSPEAQNNIVELLHGTSFFDLKGTIPPQKEREEIEGTQVYSLAAGLVFLLCRIFLQLPYSCQDMFNNN